MSNPQQPPTPEASQTALGRVFKDIRLARATELAKAERYAEVQALLVNGGQLPESAPELDLLARVAARQGRFEEASGLWNKALQFDPQNKAYRGCLESLTPAMRFKRIIATHEGKLWNLLAVAVVVVVAGLLVFVFRK